MESPSQIMLLQVANLSKSFALARGGTREIFRDVSFALKAGEFVALVGESGVGKSTLLNVIAGLEEPDTGEVKFEGALLSGMAVDARARLRRQALGFVFQAFHLLPHLTLVQNVDLALQLKGASDPARAAAMLGAVGLAGREDEFPRVLSGGEMQRVAIARALVHAPKLIIADEPTGNLDPATAGGVLALMRAELRSRGAACLMVTHSPNAAAAADRVLRLTPAGVIGCRGSSPPT